MCFPEKTISISQFKNKPWFNTELKKCVRNKNKAYSEHIRNPCDHNKQKYHALKRTSDYKIENTKNSYYKNKLLMNYTNFKQIWEVLNTILGRKKTNVQSKHN